MSYSEYFGVASLQNGNWCFLVSMVKLRQLGMESAFLILYFLLSDKGIELDRMLWEKGLTEFRYLVVMVPVVSMQLLFLI